MQELITIGTLSKIFGISTRTIRHYEKIGLFKCAANTESNYRLYGDNEIKRLEQILLFKLLGFSLKDIKVILSTSENHSVVELFNRRLHDLKGKISELNRYQETLTAITKIYQAHGLSYINNYHLMKELVYVNNTLVKVFDSLAFKLQIKILKELYRTGSLTPETIKEIGMESGQRLLNELHMTLVKELLNKVDRAVEKNIMEALQKDDPEFANEVKRAMFTFDDLAKLPDSTLQKWLLKCADEELTIALRDSGNYLRSRIFDNMSKERAEKLKQPMEDSQSATLDEAYQAMTNLINRLRQMEVDGEIILERFE